MINLIRYKLEEDVISDVKLNQQIRRLYDGLSENYVTDLNDWDLLFWVTTPY